MRRKQGAMRVLGLSPAHFLFKVASRQSRAVQFRPYLQFSLPPFQLPIITRHHPHPKMSTSLTSPHLTTSARYRLPSSRERRAQRRTTVSEKGHTHITSLTAYCYNCGVLVLGIVVSLLLCLIHKFNFITGRYVEGKS